ncbi:MAG: S8 family serine peptidase [Planctomycetota bacterium]|jgi:subtilisin family serine protease|nr:S8 family serine peptidase [Planctomycetota bacterium]MDP6761685.1 S8 family serine peptidase [Planctomycetota bacterium]MDP6990997.1 S8 family serine peptidase [Planctomycetota bacterium]
MQSIPVRALLLRSFPVAILSLFASASPAAALAPAGDVDVEASRKPPYTEVPGKLEFSGELTARPLRVSQAPDLGLTAQEVRARANTAVALLGAYDLVRHVTETDEYLIRVPAGSTENQIATQLLASGCFQYVEPNWIVYPIGCSTDPLLGNQWHHDANIMQSCDAWTVGTGDPGVVVSICDTGVRTTHQDLQLHRYEGFNSVDNQWESNGGQINDVNGHGTLTTGCAAANGNNGVGVSGVGWNTGHRMMRVSNSGSGNSTLDALTLAARTAADVGDRVASVSYSGVTTNSLQVTGQYLLDRGAWLVWAAGNDGDNLSGNRDDNIIVVGATDSGDDRAGFSNYGPFVDLFAPGVSVYSTSNGGNSSYSSASGTSFACPLTAGLVGLIWSLGTTLTPAEVEDILRQGCDDLGDPGEDNVYGFGRINSYQSADLATPPLIISFPGGIPEYVEPSGTTTLTVNTADGLDSAVPGSGVLHVSVAGQPTQVPLTDTAPGVHEGNFPATACGSQLDWYVSFALTGGGSHTSPGGAPAQTYASVSGFPAIVASDDLESDSGWTGGVAGDDATTGVWTRVDPIGTQAQPEDDHTPAPGSQCWVTGQGSNGGSNGENDVDGGSTTLLTPVYDLSGLTDPTVSYWRWYSNSSGASPNNDVFVIGASDDGGASWTTVETVGPDGAEVDGGWIQHAFLVSDFVTPSAQVRLRFVASDLGFGSIVEAAVDDLVISDLACDDCGANNYCISEPNSSGSAGEISATGSFVVGDNDLHLSAFGVAPSQPGLFYYGPNQVQFPFGNGFRCVGGTVVRLPVINSDFAGDAAYDPDLTNLPPNGQITPGSTWNFQYWFRDPVAGGANFDFTDGVEIHFCP